MATSLPPIGGASDKNEANKYAQAEPFRSVFVVQKEIAQHINNTLEDARENSGDNWAYQQLMHKLAAHEATVKKEKLEAARGQSFPEENKAHTRRHLPEARAVLLHSKRVLDRQHAASVVALRNERQAHKLLSKNVHTSLHRTVASERNRALRRCVIDRTPQPIQLFFIEREKITHYLAV